MPAAPLAPAPPPGAKRPTAGGEAYPALDLLDEAFHRLRLAPPGVLGIYYAGTLPFVWALLSFWADQSWSADADRRAFGSSLAVAAAFVGMKICHAVFTAQLTARLRRANPAPWTWKRLGRVAAVQTILQPSGLFLVALASVPVLPLGWVYAFYQNVTVLGDGGTGSAATVLRRAWRAALRAPKQNHAALSILGLLGLFVTLNLVVAVVGIPYLARMFSGEENLLTRSGVHVFNTTFLAVVGALSYLVLDPVSKAFYTLRCFYEESRRSGEDLLSELAALPAGEVRPETTTPGNAAAPATGGRRNTAITTAVLVLAAAGWVLPVHAAPAAEPPASPAFAASVGPLPGQGSGEKRAVSPPELGRSINDVLARRKFAWRVPRGAEKEADGPVESFSRGIGEWIHARWMTAKKWLDDLDKWISKRRRSDDSEETPQRTGGFSSGTSLQTVLIGLAVLLLGTVLYRVFRHWRQAPTAAGRAVPGGAVPVPDLRDDTLLATQLPEDEWLRLAQALLQSGERRLALRAFYLSALAGLAARGLLAIARHKSNRDYVLELRRRAREHPELQGAFARNVARFERVWYGEHPADEVLLADFQADRERVVS